MSTAIDLISEPERAHALFAPQRLLLLEAMESPASAAALARRLDLPRQRVNYHLRELEARGLIELAEERVRGNVAERVYRRTGAAYAVSPRVLGRLAARPEAIEDRLSADYQVALASRLIDEVGLLRAGAEAAGARLPTFSIDAEVRFADATARQAFADELASTVAELIARHHDAEAPLGRTFRFVLAAHQKPG